MKASTQVLILALALIAPLATAQERPAPAPTPLDEPPAEVLIPEPDAARKIISGDPLNTAPRPEDTATGPAEPVDPGLDGDAPSNEIPVPLYDEMPEEEEDGATDGKAPEPQPAPVPGT